MDFYYDQQIRRYLLQFIRIFADIKIQNLDENENSILQRVPIKYGDLSRIAANVIRENSQNVTLPSPMMGAWIKNFEIDNNRRQDPTFVSKITANERTYDSSANEYGTQIGNQYSIERLMPIPYKLTIELDIWTTSVTTKLQILEQILTIFNPTVQIQQNDNPIDWSSIVEITLSDITWSSRSVPVGTDTERDMASLIFTVPVWINPPAKVKKKRVIEQIHAGIFNIDIDSINLDQDILNPVGGFNEVDSQVIVTPGNYRLGVGVDGAEANEVILLTSGGSIDATLTWESLFSKYTNINEYEVTLRLKTDNELESTDGDILGLLTPHPTDANKLIFTVDEDTLPAVHSISPINSIINPVTVYPGNGLPSASAGQKYLVVSDYTSGEEPTNTTDPFIWGSTEFWENDIIMYNGAEWIVIFDSLNEEGPTYINNLTTGDLLKFNGDEWVHAYFGEYFPGYWRLEY